jgi:pimeloyl-ACP methyl ester carboxylesterase
MPQILWQRTALRPWTTWHAPLIGQWFMKRHKVLSHHGPSVTTKRGMTTEEARAYHHVFDEPDSDHVVLTWPRTIPFREGECGWDDTQPIERHLPELATGPTMLLWAPEDNVFPIGYAQRLQALLPHAEGPVMFDRAAHFLPGDAGEEIADHICRWMTTTDR